MKTKMFKKIISTLLAATMLFSMGTTVFANEDGRVCVSETTYEEITDINELISLAIEQRATINSRSSSAIDDNQLYVQQLLSKKEFSDGSKEYTSVRTGIALLDKSGSLIEPDEIVFGKMEETIANGGVTLQLSMYVASKIDPGSVLGVLVHRLDKSVSKISYVGSAGASERPISCEMVHCAKEDKYQYKTFAIKTIGTNTFTLPYTDTNFYSTELGAFISQSKVAQYGGGSFSHTVALPADFDPDPYAR